MCYHGEITVYTEDMVAKLRAGTRQCCHCGGHFEYRPGSKSGKLRGFCNRCGDLVCGPQCAECVPEERRLDNLEHGRPELTTPQRFVQSGWEPWQKGAKILAPSF